MERIIPHVFQIIPHAFQYFIKYPWLHDSIEQHRISICFRFSDKIRKWSLTSAISGLSIAFSSFRTSNQSARLGLMAYTQSASSTPRFSTQGDRQTMCVIRALQRLCNLGDRPRIACFWGSDRSDPKPSHLNLGASCTTVCHDRSKNMFEVKKVKDW